MMRNDSPVSKVSVKLMKIQKTNLTSLETTIGTKFSVLQIIRIPSFNEMWFLTTDPFTGISVFIAKLSDSQYCWRVFEDFHSQEFFQFFNIFRCVGLHDFVKVSISASLKSFLLIICIDAPESTTKSRSSSLRFDAGRHLFSEGEKKVALSRFF